MTPALGSRERPIVVDDDSEEQAPTSAPGDSPPSPHSVPLPQNEKQAGVKRPVYSHFHRAKTMAELKAALELAAKAQHDRVAWSSDEDDCAPTCRCWTRKLGGSKSQPRRKQARKAIPRAPGTKRQVTPKDDARDLEQAEEEQVKRRRLN